MTRTEGIRLTLRAIMELGVVVGFAYWGYHVGRRPGSRIALAIAAPVVGFGVWGAVDFHRFGRAAEPLRLFEELALSGLAAAGLYVAGQRPVGWALAGLSVFYHVLVYATGGRLLKPRS